MQERIDAYFESYRRDPDGNDEESRALEQAALEDLASDEEWPEAPDAEGD